MNGFDHDLVYRLRQRLDVVTDQRDAAIERANQLAKKLKVARNRGYDWKRSRDLAWTRLGRKVKP